MTDMASILPFPSRPDPDDNVDEVGKPDYNMIRVDPPAPRHPSGQAMSPMYLNLVELQAEPGTWAAFAIYDNKASARSTADQYRAARDGRKRTGTKARRLPPGDNTRWEFIHQQLDDGRWAVVACYVKEAEG